MLFTIYIKQLYAYCHSVAKKSFFDDAFDSYLRFLKFIHGSMILVSFYRGLKTWV
jgi:hypothetical protein